VKEIIVGISGASGAIYGVRTVEVLRGRARVHLIISRAAQRTIREELERQPDEVLAMAGTSYSDEDIGAAIASGSFPFDGMVVAPCSMKTLSAIATSYTDTLIARAADVALKERRRLVLAVRESPLHLGHLRLMEAVTEIGAVVLPTVPGFYFRPRTVQDLVDHTVGRILELLGIEHDLYSPWTGTSR
jgi:polyprenyl P-hydroxybenzoate/phenylacrylic acid decarboxylase-like protein